MLTRAFLPLLPLLLALGTALAHPSANDADGHKHHHHPKACDTDPFFKDVKTCSTARPFIVQDPSSDSGPPQESDDKVFYLKPGESSCGFTYTDSDPVACIDAGWMAEAEHGPSCNKWILAEFPSLGTSVQVRALDTCGDHSDPDNGFGCNDIYLSLASFSALAQGNASIIDDGHLPGDVLWSFIPEPCFACEGGLPGIVPDGSSVDPCVGPDHFGLERTGRKHGAEIKTGAAAGEACSGQISASAGFDRAGFVKALKEADM